MKKCSLCIARSKGLLLDRKGRELLIKAIRKSEAELKARNKEK